MMGGYPTGNVPDDCHPDVQWLLGYWQSKRSNRPLPGRQHIDPVELGRLLANIWVVDVQRAPLRYRYRVAGTLIVAYLGQEPTGEWLDVVIPHFAETHTCRDLKIVVADRVPRWRRGPPSLRRDLSFKTLEQLSLPLAGDGQTVDMVLILTLFLDEEGKALPPAP